MAKNLQNKFIQIIVSSFLLKQHYLQQLPDNIQKVLLLNAL